MQGSSGRCGGLCWDEGEPENVYDTSRGVSLDVQVHSRWSVLDFCLGVFFCAGFCSRFCSRFARGFVNFGSLS